MSDLFRFLFRDIFTPSIVNAMMSCHAIPNSLPTYLLHGLVPRPHFVWGLGARLPSRMMVAHVWCVIVPAADSGNAAMSCSLFRHAGVNGAGTAHPVQPRSGGGVREGNGDTGPLGQQHASLSAVAGS